MNNFHTIIPKKNTKKDRYPYEDRYNRPDDRYNSIGGGSRYRPDDRYRPDQSYGGMFPPTRRIPPRYPSPSRYPIDNSIGSDMGSRYYPENPEVTGTRYPTSDNRSPIFILKYGNRYGSSGGSGNSFLLNCV